MTCDLSNRHETTISIAYHENTTGVSENEIAKYISIYFSLTKLNITTLCLKTKIFTSSIYFTLFWRCIC